MTYDNEAIVRHAYQTAEGNVLDVAGFVGSFTDDGVFNDVVGQILSPTPPQFAALRPLLEESLGLAKAKWKRRTA